MDRQGFHYIFEEMLPEATTANPTSIDVSLDDKVLKYGLRSPNSIGSHIEQNFELFNVDDTRPESGFLAILREICTLYVGAWELTIP